MMLWVFLRFFFDHYRGRWGNPAILVEKIAIAEQGSLLMSAVGTRFNPPFAYHSTMIITSGSLAGQGAAITLTVIYGTLRSRVPNRPTPLQSRTRSLHQ